MGLKKAGLIAAGVLTAGVVAAPLAWAADGVTAPDPCSFGAVGEDANEGSAITEDNPVNLVPQAPLGGDNIGIHGQCSTYGNDNNQGNGLGNTYQLPGNVSGDLDALVAR